MNKLFKLEVFKSRRRHVWDVVVLLLGVQLMWGMWGTNAYARNGQELLWSYGLYQFSMLNCLMMPFAVAILASRLSDIEHKSSSLRLLCTLAPPGSLYTAKFLWGALILLVASVGQTLMLMLASTLIGFAGAPPYVHMALLALSTFVCSLCLLALQQALSLLVKNQIVALMAGLGGGFIGFFALAFQGGVANLSIWSLFARLSTVAVDWGTADRTMRFWFTVYNWPLALCVLGIAVLFYLAGRSLFVRREW